MTTTTLWTFDFEATDRLRWPSTYGRVTVLADSYHEAFNTAFAMVYLCRDVSMVTMLELVL